MSIVARIKVGENLGNDEDDDHDRTEDSND